MIGSFAWRSRSLRGRRTQFFVLPEICCTDILADNPQTDIKLLSPAAAKIT
jgi:hypothetical protein